MQQGFVHPIAIHEGFVYFTEGKSELKRVRVDGTGLKTLAKAENHGNSVRTMYVRDGYVYYMSLKNLVQIYYIVGSLIDLENNGSLTVLILI
jgi:hypothetical protein